jgi:hypothetical protein
MRLSIVYDENGVILAASLGREDPDKLGPGLTVTSGYVDLPDDMPDGELRQAVERQLSEMDPRNPKQSPARQGADYGQT